MPFNDTVPLGVSRDVVLGVGMVAITATRLEWALATLVCVTAEPVEDIEQNIGRNGSDLRRELRDRAASLDTSLRLRLLHWEQTADGLLEERHRLLHATWFADPDRGYEASTLHFKSGTESVPSYQDLEALSSRLATAAAAGLKLAVDLHRPGQMGSQ
jgi:hypothetical protein